MGRREWGGGNGAIMRGPTLAQHWPLRMTATAHPTATARILDGKRIAEELLDSLKGRVDARLAAGK